MLTVIATITAKSGRVGEVRRELDKLVTATRREEGCINYDLHVSLKDACTFVFYENWESGEALRAHAASPHMQAWAGVREALLAAPVKVELFHMLSEPA
ncbi:antibiotic biosynthesis monooxygenase [bacterium]|nr:MAG: antibiotic biosynthesis monooxygenase [bacterium]RIK61085.1 MAG: antibiotic biosynthesis monooxygenase [Planctomycetota bacterium]